MKERLNIIFIGDSLTEYFDWQERFPMHSVTNLGISGEPVEGLFGRVRSVRSIAEVPDLIFVMTGINNIAMEDYGIMETYRKVVASLRSSFPASIVVVQSILPVILHWVDNAGIVRINEALREMAFAGGAEFLDVYRLFVDRTGRSISSCLLDDGVHLSQQGYEVWSRAVENFLGEKITS